jgi:hypothetical protein
VKSSCIEATAVPDNENAEKAIGNEMSARSNVATLEMTMSIVDRPRTSF